ncbi:4-diphosphocytidyl-2C-methyl-D-erythritolkinase [Truepera radiovictrix DSM 17093]|uniref:4-diphosphocytidyl-2-C-methyl-D-erythritol kinase n=1 Tax=Truepera radiovictrix (strain DSM 17093 / CIP 108686 / LMG 22925 / RQ-24) TaxID=649638 RepID=D7CV85_TRURR|nr:4-diphosphocytidyl-2C-methyl-D-erythritolkinase [Truepera radiovictrix DSM 17093]
MTVQLTAHAKVNLGLSLLGRRGDGFHEIDTVMVRLDLGDQLTVALGAPGVRLRVAGAELGIPPEENLVYRAAEAYLGACSSACGVDLTLVKHLPAAAGLGGGSSDAGATLRALAQLRPAAVDLAALAAALGSDVPFFARDLPAARATGRGEVLTPLELPPLHLVLANPGVAVSARDAYGYVARYGGPLDVPALVAGLARYEPDYPNDLEPGVIARVPVVGEVLAALRGAGLRGVRMSGSGSTCFGLATSAAAAARAAADLARAHPAWWVRAAKTG